jgi:surface protein
MFDNCKSETILGLDNFNTANVTDMAFMFNASKATELDLSNFNTSRVTDMENMFCNCDVEDLDISNFDTSSVTNMSCMFENVTAPIDTSTFDTSEVTTMHNMFKGTSGTTLDLSNFDTSSVTNMSGMFQNSSYNAIDVSSFDTSSVTNMSSMFSGSTESNLDISNFDFSDVTDISYMLGSKTLNSLTLPNNFNTSNIVNITGLFRGLNIPNLDLRGIEFESAETQQNLFAGLTTNTLDISDWDLGEHAAATAPSWYPYSSQSFYEGIFSGAQIQDLRLSNNNNFPEGYKIAYMFNNFITDGILDLSSFHFNKAVNQQSSEMFHHANINTLIMGNITRNEFANDLRQMYNGNYSSFFNQTVIGLLDMSSSLIEIGNGNCFFDGLIATRINMPNQICVDLGSSSSINIYPSNGKAKYVDYSSVDTRNADYTDNQWMYMSRYVTQNNKIVWIPSTFVLDGNRTMYSTLRGDVYTDAPDYTTLGWNAEPANVIMHYSATHADFETAILNDNVNEWISPQGYPIFFCHPSVPLGSAMTINQFEAEYDTVYWDGVLIDPNNFTFNDVGSHVLRIVYQDYPYEQTITVVDHGNSYTVVGNPYDYTWSTTNYTYVASASTCVECRLYPDKYLFVYPKAKVEQLINKYTAITSAPNTTITKVSGIPFQMRQFNLQNCRQLTDISELIVCTSGYSGSGAYTHLRGFNPGSMFYNCTSLVDVSSVGKWLISTSYEYYYRSSGYTYTTYGYYGWSSTFSNTHITTAPSISLTPGSNSTFYGCTYLTDISKLKVFGTESSSNGNYFSGVFSGCSNLSNVSRLSQCLSSYTVDRGSIRYSINLSSFLAGTPITNTDFIPDNLCVNNIDSMFYNCTSLRDISGMGRIYRTFRTFYSPFYNVPATDYSALDAWKNTTGNLFSSIGFEGSKMSNLSFLSNWDLSYCTNFSFNNCSNLTSISALNGKIDTTKDITVNLSYCSALTSLVGLSGITFSTSSYFQNCSGLTSLNGLQGCTIKSCYGLFTGCSSLSDITALSQVTFSGITDIYGMFSGCSSLTSLDGLEGLDISNCTNLNNVFSNCSSLTDIDAIEGWNPYQVKQVSSLFYNCSSITSFAALHNWTTSQLTSMTSTFYNCSSLLNLDGLVGFNPGQCTSLTSVFNGCSALTDISDIAYWYVGRCQNMSSMFNGCTSLTSIAPLANWNVSALQNAQYMFQGCTSLASTAGLNNWSVATLAYTQYMFKGCTSLTSITALADWNVVTLSNMSYMFDGDIAITDADSIDVWKNKRTMTRVTRTYAFRNVPRPWPTWAQS